LTKQIDDAAAAYYEAKDKLTEVSLQYEYAKEESDRLWDVWRRALIEEGENARVDQASTPGDVPGT